MLNTDLNLDSLGLDYARGGGTTPFQETSKLVEPGAKYFLRESLKQCHRFKDHYYNYYFNMAAGVLFVAVFGGILLAMYKGKPTPVEKMIKQREQQQYIMAKIKAYQHTRQQERQELITNLPKWEVV